MKFFKWFTNRSGKFALSALQTAGIATVVGVAGLGAWNMLSTPQEDQPSAPMYNPGEVVYVAGAPAGGVYQSGAYVGGDSHAVGKDSTAGMVRAKTLTRLNDSAQRDDSYEAMQREQERSLRNGAQQVTQGAGTEGLHMNGNDIDPELLQGNPMDVVTNQMGNMQKNMQGMIEQFQGQANPAANAKLADAANRAATAGNGQLTRANMASVGGGNGGGANAFVIQNSGRNNGGSSKGGQGAQMDGDAIAAAQAQAAKMMEGAQMRAKGMFGPQNGMGNSVQTRGGVGGWGNMKAGKDLDWIARRSNKAAATATRSTNEGNRAFLGSERVSGGLQVVGDETVDLGDGQDSKDFSNEVNSNLGNLGKWAASVSAEQLKRDQDRHGVQSALWLAIGSALAAMVGIFFAIKTIPSPWNWIAASGIAAGGLFMVARAVRASIFYARDWGGTSLTTWAGIICGILTAGIGAAFFVGSAALKAKTETAAAGATGLVDSPIPTSNLPATGGGVEPPHLTT